MRQIDDISVSFDEFFGLKFHGNQLTRQIAILMKKSKASVKKIIRLGVDLIGIPIEAN